MRSPVSLTRRRVRLKNPKLLYTKDELPTWNEFHEFILKGNFKFDNGIDTEIDPYWKYPSQLMKLMWSCNQLNKFLFDDNVQNTSFWLTNDVTADIMGGYFRVFEKRNKDFPNVKFLIYHCINPTTRKYSDFITNDTYREDIENFFYKEDVRICLKMFYNPTNERIHIDQKFHKFLYSSEDSEFIQTINRIAAEVTSYYKDPIGWKE